MTRRIRFHVTLHVFLAAVMILPFTTATAGATSHGPASELLLPCFEVSIDRARTTVFDVVNETDQSVPIRITVSTNWGIAVSELDTRLTLAAHDVLPVDLATWLVDGRLPGRTLSAEALGHVQAALCGEASARTGMTYGTPMELRDAPLLVGSVRIRVDDHTVRSRPDALWGNSYVLDSDHGSAQAEALLGMSQQDPYSGGLCSDHGVRLISGGRFDGGTELMVWNPTTGHATRDGRYADERVETRIRVYDEDGKEQARIVRYLEPLAMLRADDLGLPVHFGWLEVETETESAVAVRYSAGEAYSVAVGSSCMDSIDAGIALEKLTNGVDADFAPGPWMTFGDRVDWSYEVTNTGGVTLTGIRVRDNDVMVAVSCPDDTLLPKESMTCTAQGVATSCFYENVGTVSAITMDGLAVRDSDASHYRLRQEAAIALDVNVNGVAADTAPGPVVELGTAVDWAYVVRNTGPSMLNRIVVADERGVGVFCPKSQLAAAESMTCTARVVAAAGSQVVRSSVTGTSPCDVMVGDSQTSYYQGTEPIEPNPIDIRKYTNGEDADLPPGPSVLVGEAVEWIYVVANVSDGDVANVTVTDDQVGPVPCPRHALAAGESMTCTVHGTAVEGQYRNVAVVTATTSDSREVTAEDASHYLGVLADGR